MADDNPLLPDDVQTILGRYSPEELAAYRARGMLDSRGIPTVPPGYANINSRGYPYYPGGSAEEMARNKQGWQYFQDAFKKGQNPFADSSDEVTASSDNSTTSYDPSKYIGRQLNFQEAKQFAQQAGFQGPKADLMAAIAMAESYGWTNAYNGVGRDDSYGITQINAKAHGDIAKEAYNNPLRAMQLAFDVSKGGTNFSPWTTYTSGAYKKYLDNPNLVAGGALKTGGKVPPDMTANAGLTGQINPLELPNTNDKELKDKVVNAMLEKPAQGGQLGGNMIANLLLLALSKNYKITPINYDPWKYAPKVEIKPMNSSGETA